MIQVVTNSLDSILLQKSILLNLPQSNSHMSLNSYRETHSCNSFVVIGRELEKNKIVNMLTKDDNESSHGTLKVITIVGMGGLGKTTLAQLAFNDEGVKAHFESSRMWTVVGAEFNPVKIMKSVLELATDAPVKISQIDSVRKNLEKTLSGKKFLLVLDDVWNKDPLKWGVLKAALTCGARGSKILVTTRSQQVSSIMGSSNTTHQLQQLSGYDCLSLFKQFAFGDEVADRTLMEIGRKIVEKCGGVPLAAISLGSMLRSSREETYWSSVLKSEIWQLGNEEDKVLAVLKLSYDTLPPRSKKCFAFASLFPKNTRIAKDELIRLWIANGFIRSEGNFDAETNGKHVFNDLVMGLFFLFEDKCTMHDLMRDLARSVSANIYWNSKEDLVKHSGNRTYHLHLESSDISKITQALGKKSLYLRTLILIHCYLYVNLPAIVFSELKFLRVLDLSYNGIREVPTSIENLIHLRYLNLSRNHIEVLPDSVTLLPNLQYLNLSFNHGLRQLPKELGNMQNLWDFNLSGNNIQVLPDSITLLSNLRYLNLSFNVELRELPKELGNMQNLRDLDLQRDFRLTHMPCGLSQLTNLRSLPLFIAGDKTSACSIIELEDLKLHGKMEIKFSNDYKNYSCGGRKILKNKDLNELCLEFNGSERYDNDMLDDLCPNTSLKKLSIWDYMSPQFPTWLIELQLPKLVEVSLVNCRGCEPIPPFGNLQFLKKLCLRSMADFTQMGAEFYGYRGFPSLQELFLYEMNNLEEWSESHGVVELFPKLQSLKILGCRKLKSMPRLPRIQHLDISCCSGSILSCIGGLTSLSVLQVEKMNDMTSLPSGWIRNLTSLTELQIKGCRQLQSLPGDEMQYLEMLRSLTIEQCYNLASFPSKVGRLSSLCFLRLRGCPSIILQPEELVEILNSVHEFKIHICGNKVNLSGQLQYLHKLKKLSLCGAHDESFTYNYKIGNEIQKLTICCCDELESLMTTEPTSSALQKLKINDISNLTTLPEWLQHLKSLHFLSIQDCPRLERVPRGLKNLYMLKRLWIVGCPQLKSRCQRETGEDWPIISYVPYVHIP
ncbi:putative disease resistance protein RGA4 [Zingiber officinale]|nr:putative disease resistance protein RGA4 [Zingiber officinale]XP_042378693.1 putative disease resistance protein RGA4 [Zingiber officinale]XP_042378695.1 putative disease resistance protein RGA4 [Zingiber officinale]